MVMEKLAAGLEKLGIKAGERELALFQIYYEELTDWNQRMNLTAITEYEWRRFGDRQKASRIPE
jgi:16S rRNA (guanine527-N7)-methyltransferase